MSEDIHAREGEALTWVNNCFYILPEFFTYPSTS